MNMGRIHHARAGFHQISAISGPISAKLARYSATVGPTSAEVGRIRPKLGCFFPQIEVGLTKVGLCSTKFCESWADLDTFLAELSQARPTLVQDQIEPSFGQSQPMFIWTGRPNLGRNRPSMARNRASLGRNRSTLARTRPQFGPNRDVGQTLTKFKNTWPGLCQIRPTCGRNRPGLSCVRGNFSRVRQVWPKLDDVHQTREQHAGRLGQIWVGVLQLGAGFGRLRADPGHM